jgi:hypothetical protein
VRRHAFITIGCHIGALFPNGYSIAAWFSKLPVKPSRAGNKVNRWDVSGYSWTWGAAITHLVLSKN